MRHIAFRLALLVAVPVGSVLAQVENLDFRIRAKFDIPNDSQWGAGESVGGADFRIHSRFLQLYYGGVHRADEFKFSISLDFTSVPDFAQFSTSPYNTNYDVYINDAFVGRVIMNNLGLGIGELTYKSRHASPPDLPLPLNFPDPVNVGDLVRVFFAAPVVPVVGEPLPAGTPVFSGNLEEQFARGDVNQDGKVDLLDFNALAGHYDPFDLVPPHIGPAFGDFSGDNRSTRADYDILAQNWTSSTQIPAPPSPIATPCTGDLDGDHSVGSADLGILLSNFGIAGGATYQQGDTNLDGAVNESDIGALLGNWAGACP
ncbi:MAG: dockerin type I domain-containing protein [Phycisphaerae bacterium]